jgi:hypothetical protein
MLSTPFARRVVVLMSLVLGTLVIAPTSPADAGDGTLDVTGPELTVRASQTVGGSGRDRPCGGVPSCDVVVELTVEHAGSDL